jgi:hypothetical protein
VLKLVIPGVLGLALLAFSWISLLRVDNMAHDMTVLRADVDGLKQQVAAMQGPTAAATSPPSTPLPDAGAAAPPPRAPAAAPATAPAAPAQTYEATPLGFFSSTSSQPQVVTLPLPPGTAPRGAQVVVVAVEGEGVAPVALPSPQPRLTLQPGVPQSMFGLCQGPEGAAWVFTLEGATVRIESRDCRYPVRGLRPRIRVTVLQQ